MQTNKDQAQPQHFRVNRLEQAVEVGTATGRPRKAKMPPLPKGLLDGMSTLEQQHFWFFIEAFKQDYKLTKPTDLIALYQAALEYVNTLRVQAVQLETGQVISMARQHPGVQMRAWLDMLDSTRKARNRGTKAGADKSQQQQDFEAELSRLSSGAK